MAPASRQGETADPDRIRRWLALHHGPCSARDARALLANLPVSQNLGVGAVPVRALARDRLQALLTPLDDAHWARIEAWRLLAGNDIVTWADADYPPRLRELGDAPLALYLHGNRALLTSPQLAIVGSRNPTPTGAETAHAFAAALAASGLTIVSGLALGIDAAAHRGALAGTGATIAVMGTGLDRVYPARHRSLAHDIAQAGGLLISELPLGSPPRREHFPRRNRLISGMSAGVLVVEAAVQSGSLITARLANEQGREVFAIPGSIHSPLARGCHALIREGAKLVETAQDVLEELMPLFALQAPTPIDEAGDVADSSAALDGEEIKLLRAMAHDPVDVDTLGARSGLTSGVISSMLLRMELRGIVSACAGGKYVKTATRLHKGPPR